ncbi:MAG: TPR end-of-group domain-containing protein [Candidatus Omnitrophota bacterium]
MESSEDRELKRIIEEFGKGIELFRQHRYGDALPMFEAISNEFKDSSSYRVAEVEARSKVYKKICETQLNPTTVSLETDEDFLFNGIFHLNAGKIDMAFERFKYLEKKSYNDPFLSYLLALVYFKKHEKENCLNYLGMAISQDESYKIIAHNEPDFDPMFEDANFSQLIEIKNEFE